MSSFSMPKFLSNAWANTYAVATDQGAQCLHSLADQTSKAYASASSSCASFYAASAEKISSGLTSGSVLMKEGGRLGSEAFVSISSGLGSELKEVEFDKKSLMENFVKPTGKCISAMKIFMNHVVKPTSLAACSGLKEFGSTASIVGYASYLIGKDVVAVGTQTAGKHMREVQKSGSVHMQQAWTRYRQADEKVQVAVMGIIGLAALIPFHRLTTAIRDCLWGENA